VTAALSGPVKPVIVVTTVSVSVSITATPLPPSLAT